MAYGNVSNQSLMYPGLVKPKNKTPLGGTGNMPDFNKIADDVVAGKSVNAVMSEYSAAPGPTRTGADPLASLLGGAGRAPSAGGAATGANFNGAAAMGDTAQPTSAAAGEEFTPDQYPTASGGYDFWKTMRELMEDADDKYTDDEWTGITGAWASDPKWKPPTSAAAQRLLNIAKMFKTLGFEAEQYAPLVQKALEMGFRQPKFQLSMFNSLLQPYGLGTSGQ